MLGRDDEDADEPLAGRPAAAAARDGRDQPDVGIAAHGRRLLRCEERALELVDGRRVDERRAHSLDRRQIAISRSSSTFQPSRPSPTPST